MARDLNKAQIIGRLGADPEQRQQQTPGGGDKVTTFRVGVNRQMGQGGGEQTEWFNVVAWGKLGDTCKQYLAKGSRVYVEGRLQTRSWEDQQSGQTRSRMELVAADMIILDERGGRRGPPPDEWTSGPPPDFGGEDVPF